MWPVGWEANVKCGGDGGRVWRVQYNNDGRPLGDGLWRVGQAERRVMAVAEAGSVRCGLFILFRECGRHVTPTRTCSSGATAAANRGRIIVGRWTHNQRYYRPGELAQDEDSGNHVSLIITQVMRCVFRKTAKWPRLTCFLSWSLLRIGCCW